MRWVRWVRVHGRTGLDPEAERKRRREPYEAAVAAAVRTGHQEFVSFVVSWADNGVGKAWREAGAATGGGGGCVVRWSTERGGSNRHADVSVVEFSISWWV